MTDWIDAHHHLWTYDPHQYPWMSDRMDVLQRDYEIDLFKSVTRPLGVIGSVAVQARQMVEETDYLLAIAEQDDFVLGVVGWLPLTEPDVQGRIEDKMSHRKLKGLRHVLHDERDPNYMLREDFNRGVACLASHGLTYDLLIRPEHLPQTLAFVDRHPRQVFIVDHIAKPTIALAEEAGWREGMETLGQRPNVYCKISGMVTEADWLTWSDQELVPYLDKVLTIFGPERLMFGSDWPVMTLASTYDRWITLVGRWLETLTANEARAVRVESAIRAYGLKPPAGRRPHLSNHGAPDAI